MKPTVKNCFIIEHCCQCAAKHAYCTQHDEAKYLAKAEQLKEAIKA